MSSSSLIRLRRPDFIWATRGKLNSWVSEKVYEKGQIIGSMATKESLARYRGATCGVRYAEALHNPIHKPIEIL